MHKIPMKSICKILILLLWVLSLTLTLLSCVGGKDDQEDDSWMAADDGTVERQKAMRQQQFNHDDDENAYQSSERIQLPIIP